jgi:hypothetical protein
MSGANTRHCATQSPAEIMTDFPDVRTVTALPRVGALPNAGMRPATAMLGAQPRSEIMFAWMPTSAATAAGGVGSGSRANRAAGHTRRRLLAYRPTPRRRPASRRFRPATASWSDVVVRPAATRLVASGVKRRPRHTTDPGANRSSTTTN